MPPGHSLLYRVRVLTLVPKGSGQLGVEVSLNFVIELDADDLAAAGFDFITDLVIEPVELGVVNCLFGFLQTVVGDLAAVKEFAAMKNFVTFLGERHHASGRMVRIGNA